MSAVISRRSLTGFGQAERSSGVCLTSPWAEIEVVKKTKTKDARNSCFIKTRDKTWWVKRHLKGKTGFANSSRIFILLINLLHVIAVTAPVGSRNFVSDRIQKLDELLVFAVGQQVVFEKHFHQLKEVFTR